MSLQINGNDLESNQNTINLNNNKNTNRTNKQDHSSNHHNYLNKENFDFFNNRCDETVFHIKNAQIEIQTVEAIQMNLDSIPLYTCDLDDNLDIINCFCLTHEIDKKV